MKRLTLILVLLAGMPALAQTGYVKLDNDSIVAGYMKFYTDRVKGTSGWEVWKTKKDKHPRRIPSSVMKEYAIKDDTFRVFHDLKPFYDEDFYFELIELSAMSRGKVNLYRLPLAAPTATLAVALPGGAVGGAIVASISLIKNKKSGGRDFIYMLENPETGFISGIPANKDEIIESLRDFFPEKYLTRYNEEKEEISYKSLLRLVRLYNSK